MENRHQLVRTTQQRLGWSVEYPSGDSDGLPADLQDALQLAIDEALVHADWIGLDRENPQYQEDAVKLLVDIFRYRRIEDLPVTRELLVRARTLLTLARQQEWLDAELTRTLVKSIGDAEQQLEQP